MPKNSCIMQIWAESGKSALPICNYSQILYQFLTFTQNLKRSQKKCKISMIYCEVLLSTSTRGRELKNYQILSVNGQRSSTSTRGRELKNG